MNESPTQYAGNEPSAGSGRAILLVGIGLIVMALAVLMAPTRLAGAFTDAIVSAPSGERTARNAFFGLGIVVLVVGSGLMAWAWAGLWARGGLVLACVAAVGVYLAFSFAVAWYINDDAGVSFLYARNLVQGHGLVYNVGDPPVEGYSNPLWTFLLGAGRGLGFAIIPASKVLGIALGILCILWVALLLRDQGDGAAWGLIVLGANASFVIWTGSGLENGLHALLLVALVAVIGGTTLTMGRLVMAGLVLALLIWSRPEGPLFTVAVSAWLAGRWWFGQPIPRKSWMVLLLPALSLAVLLTFRLLYFHDVLPNTYYAKAGHSTPLRFLNPFSGGWRYVAEGVTGMGWGLALVPVLLTLGRWRASPRVQIALVVVIAQLFFVVTVGGDWMGEFRFLSVIAPVLGLLVGLGFAQLGAFARHAGAGRLGWGVVVAVTLLIVTVQIPRLLRFADAPTTSLRVVAKVGQYFVDWAEQAGIAHPTLAHHDAGGTSFVARIHLIDLGGLCDRTIAKHWQDRERLRRYLFEEKRPDFIYSGPVFARKLRLDEFAEFHRDYRPLPPVDDPELEGVWRHVRVDHAHRLGLDVSEP